MKMTSEKLISLELDKLLEERGPTKVKKKVKEKPIQFAGGLMRPQNLKPRLGKVPKPMWDQYVAYLRNYTTNTDPGDMNSNGVGMLPLSGSFHPHDCIYVNNRQLSLTTKSGRRFDVHDQNSGTSLHHLISRQQTSINMGDHGQQSLAPRTVYPIYTMNDDGLCDLIGSIYGKERARRMISIRNPFALSLEMNEMLRDMGPGFRTTYLSATPAEKRTPVFGSSPKGDRVELTNIHIADFTDPWFRPWSMGKVVAYVESMLQRTIGTSDGWRVDVHLVTPTAHLITFQNTKAQVFSTKQVGHKFYPTAMVYFGNKRGFPTMVKCGLASTNNPFHIMPMGQRFERVFSHQAYPDTFANNVSYQMKRWIETEMMSKQVLSNVLRKLKAADAHHYKLRGGLVRDRWVSTWSPTKLAEVFPRLSRSAMNIHHINRSLSNYSDATKIAIISWIGYEMQSNMRHTAFHNPRKFVDSVKVLGEMWDADWGNTFKKEQFSGAEYNKLRSSDKFSPFY